ncbi:hypothetical protein PVAP13_2KG429700 [Panicum virgatum]|uniref:Uncharacterized protein n=1 Tax=Panicum virgatum TaxID=38727 RepID=A0A8T0WAJ1_PANVG|nr:hypothetical protein PVAP13_2KG429700 [Panicum virgatum]
MIHLIINSFQHASSSLLMRGWSFVLADVVKALEYLRLTEPSEPLQTYWSSEVLLPSHKNEWQVYFGQNAVCWKIFIMSANGEGRIIKVGYPVYVMQSFTSSESDEVPT